MPGRGDASGLEGTQFKPGNPGGPGRPSKMAKWQEMVEDEFDRVVKPLFDALDANQSASFQGEVSTSTVPDFDKRLAATREILDRVYGKPTQRTEHTGQVDLRALMTGDVGDAFTP